MSIWSIVCAFGIPALLLGYCIKKFKQQAAETEAMKKGIQALLRADMIKDYNHYTKKGYAPIYAKDNFENVYKNYHALGANGVMSSLYETFMALPTEGEEK